MTLRIIFAGTPEFACVALAKLHSAGFEIALVLTQPDRPAGRGMKLQASAVKAFALEKGLALAQPRSLRLDGKYPQDAAQAQAAIQGARADAMVVAAYGLILPQWVLDLPRLGCLNIHASLLPRWRGAAPIHRAIEAGDTQTGITIMQMNAGLDTGDMLLVEHLDIGSTESTGQLHDKLAVLGGRMIVDALALAAVGSLKSTKQPAEGVTYAHKVEKSEATIDWTLSADVIVRRVHAFDPFPGATAVLDAVTLKVWGAAVSPQLPPANTPVGTILVVAQEGVAVAAMNSIVILTELQRPSGKRLGVADFLRGHDLKAGMVFEPRPA